MTATVVTALPWFAVGALVGGVYWPTLRWSAETLAVGGSWVRALALQVTRFATLGALLAGVAIRGGALALLVSAGGLMVARAVVLRRVGRD